MMDKKKLKNTRDLGKTTQHTQHLSTARKNTLAVALELSHAVLQAEQQFSRTKSIVLNKS